MQKTKMNYQKLLSRFYTPVEQANEEILNNEIDISAECDVPCPEPEVQSEYNEQALLMSCHSDPISPVDFTTVEPLSADQIRWFYKANEDKLWCEFNGYDSMLIETKYRDILDKTPNSPLNDKDFKHSDVVIKINDSSSPSKITKKNEDPNNSPAKHSHDSGGSQDSSKSDSFDDEANKVDKIVVRGGMYEVDLKNMSCESIYWPGEKYVITRGLYFYDGTWQPLERSYGEVLEAMHIKLFCNKDETLLDKSPVAPGSALHAHYFMQFHVEWMSSNEIYLYWGGAPRQLVRSVTQKFGFYQSTGYRLRRGYKNVASLSEKPPDITHVVFVIHGIGQKIDREKIIRNTNALRTTFDWLRIHYPPQGKNGEGRAELFPARWKVGSRGSAASLLAAAAPSGAQALRRIINDVAMDVMYYTSPIYGQEIQDDLKRELNRLYTMFMARNPNYRGHFSAVAHSLGSVILYDIIIGHQIGCTKCTKKDNEQDSNLLFPLQNIFCLGSPLSVFLALRHPTPSLKNVFPSGFTPRLYNIYHVSDPVAYRMEPLISKHHSRNLPVVIQPYHAVSSPGTQSSPAKGPWKIWSYVKHPWQKVDGVSPIPQTQSDVTDSPISLEKNNTATVAESEFWSAEFINLESTEQLMKDVKEKLQSQVKEIPSTDDVDNKATEVETIGDPLPYRIDYTIRDTVITNSYLSAITSHTSYWNNCDIAHFILERLFPGSDDLDVAELNMTYKSQL